MRHSLALLCFVWLLSCSPDLVVGDNVRIRCATDADCPADNLRCNRTEGLCEIEAGNLSPIVTLTTPEDAAARFVDTIPIAFTLSDPNGIPEGVDRADVTLQFSLDGEVWCSSQNSTGDHTDVAATAIAADLSLAWSALDDAACLADAACAEQAGCNGVELPVVAVDTDGDGVTDQEQLGWVPRLLVRLVATDDGVPAKRSAAAISSPFAAGNDPPGVVLEPLTEPSYRGVIPVSFFVEDSAGDQASVELLYRPSAEAEWQEATIAGGPTRGLATRAPNMEDPDDEPFILLWDSMAADGVGQQNLAGVGLRMRATDQHQAKSGLQSQRGPWSDAVTLTVLNQEAPRAELLQALNAGGTAPSGALAFSYYLVDEESDLVDVRFEYSVDGGDTWFVCTEYPTVLSEGRVDLASAPTSLQGHSGIEHLYFWDLVADLGAMQQTARVRVTPADDGGRGSFSETVVGVPLGVSGSFANDWAYSAQTAQSGGTSRAARLGDFNGDGLADITYSTGSGFEVRFGNGASGFGSAYLHTVTFPPVTDFAVGDLNGDGAEDLVVRVASPGDPSYFRTYLGPYGATQALTKLGVDFGSPGVLGRVRAGDLNCDGNLDLVAEEIDRLEVFPGDGTGEFGATPVSLGSGRTVDYVVADLTGDGCAEIFRAQADHVGGMGQGWVPRPATLELYAGSTGTIAPTTPAVVAADVMVLDYDDTDPGYDPFSGMALTVGDFDEDGLSDVALTDPGSTPARFLTIGGSRTGELAVRSLWELDRLPASIFAVDQDGNGTDDLLVATARGPTAFLSLLVAGVASGGTPTFRPVLDATHTFNASRILAADVNQDGWGDFITFSSSEHTVHLASQIGHFPDTPALVEQTVEMEWSPTALASGDFDADGVEDLLVSHSGSDGFISRYLAAETARGVATEGFAVGHTAKLYETLSSDKDGRLGDVNGDGLLDSVLLDSDNDQIWVMLAEKDAGMGTERVLVPTTAIAKTVGAEYLRAVADMNDDGFDDLIVGGSSSVSVWTSLHSGGTWTWDFDTSHVASSVSADTVTVTDIDLDGYVDVIGEDFMDLTFSFGDGAGNLPASCTVAVGENITGVAVGFFDADSIPDIAVTVGTAATNNRVRVYRGSTTRCGVSEVTQTQDTSMLGFVTALIAHDLDSDGALDLVASTRSVGANTEPGVYAWRGSSVGGERTAVFHEPVRISTSTASGLVVSDHNSDGLLDISFVEGANDAWVTARGSRGNPWVPWSVPLTFESDADGWMLVEEATAPSAGLEDRFGNQRQFRMHRRIYTGVEPRQHHRALRGQFIAQLHAEGLLDSSALPITAAWDTGSRLALRSVSADDLPALPSFVGRRMQLFERFAPLDASQGPDLTENRGLRFCLPMHEPYQGADLTGNAVRVLGRRDRFVRADEWPADPFVGISAADRLLPRIEEEEGGPATVFRVESTWLELTRDGNDDLSDGSGIRFAVDDPSAATQICLETDRLGIFQAFAVRL